MERSGAIFLPLLLPKEQEGGGRKEYPEEHLQVFVIYNKKGGEYPKAGLSCL